jgi:hypothetical protein
MKNLNSIVNAVNGISKCTFGVSLIAETEPSMNKTGNPYLGRVRKVSYRTNVLIGANYEGVVNSHLRKEGFAGDYKASAPNGMEWVDGCFLRGIKNPDKYYLRVMTRNDCEYYDEFFLLDGEEVTDAAQVADIKSYIKGHSPSKKQAEAGLIPEKQVKVCSYGTDGILAIWQGDKGYKPSESEAYYTRFMERKAARKEKA